MLTFDYYYSFRSPYSYLAIHQIATLEATYEARANIRVVRPLAMRVPGFFKTVNPQFGPYLLRDTFRISQMLGIPYGWPKPDPIVMDMATGEVAADQPYIMKVSRMGVAAAEQGNGMVFLAVAGALIWSGTETDWHLPGKLEAAADAAGLDGKALARIAEEEASRLDAIIEANEAAHKNAGHWGVPLFVFEHEPFFGQDRIEHLIWRMKQKGLMPRAA